MIFSKMMLGTVQFGLNYGIANKEGQPSLEKVKGILRSAAEFGVNTLDTAAAYGDGAGGTDERPGIGACRTVSDHY